MAYFNRTYRVEPDGTRVDGVFVLAFIHNGRYHLTPIPVYQDGMIDCWGLVDFQGFQEKVRSGWVVTQPPATAEVTITFLGQFRAVRGQYWVEPEEFIKEVADEIEELNGRPTTSDRCRAAWEAYQQHPCPESRTALREAYEAIPKHNRRYVLQDMDSKDGPIRAVIYGGEAEGN